MGYRRDRDNFGGQFYIKVDPDDDCFWNEGMVTKRLNNISVTTCVDKIKAGDVVLTCGGFEKVLFVYLPKDADALSEILKIELSNGAILGITESHLMFDKDANMRAANTFKVGEYVQTVDGNAKIAQIAKSHSKIRSIVTMNGELVVDSIRVSSYSGSASRAKALHQLVTPARLISGFDGDLASKICQISVPVVKYLMKYL